MPGARQPLRWQTLVVSRLNYADRDSDDYWEEKQIFLDELRDRLGPEADAEVVGDAGLLLDWTVNYGDGDLSRYSVDDLDGYLLDWCPRKVSSTPDGYLKIIKGAKEWITHLVLTDQWTGGPVKPLLDRIDTIVPEFLEAMSDPANFGLAKGMVLGPALRGADIDLNDPESLAAAMDAFNELPFEERKALTDQFMGPGSAHAAARGGPSASTGTVDDELIQLPPVPAPDLSVAKAQAEVAPLITQLAAVREYLGVKGIKLTSTGNPKLVDAKVLRDIFDTDDQWEQGYGEDVKPVRSADKLPHLQFLLEVAKEAGAISRDGRTLTAAAGWDNLQPLDRCILLMDIALELGPTRILGGRGPFSFFDAMDELLAVGILHLIIPAYLIGEVAYEEMLDRAVEIIAGELETYFPEFVAISGFRDIVDRGLSRCVDVLERCGVVARVGAEMVRHRYEAELQPSGGTVTMGDLGRQAMAAVLPSIGYQSNELIEDELIDLADCSAADAARVFEVLADAEAGEVWADWLPGADPADKVDQVLAALEEGTDPYQRISLAALLSEAPLEARRRAEAIIGGKLAAYALMALDDSDSEPAAPGSVDFGSVDFGSVDLGSVDLGGEPGDDVDWSARIRAGAEDGSLRILLSDGRSPREALLALPPALSLLPLLDMLWIQMMENPGDLLAATAELGSSGGPSLIELLNDLWRVDVPETAEVLEFIGREHPDKHVAKVARKVLFRHRNV